MPDSDRYDAIVVGAGLTGAWSAKTFAEAGVRVAILDAGSMIDAAAFEGPAPVNPTALRNQLHRLKLLAQGEFKKAFDPPLQKETQSFFLSEHTHPYVSSDDPFTWSRVHVVGGRGHFWGRVMLRFERDEFKNFWPIDYEDIEPYYSEVEAALRLGGAPSDHPGVPDGNYQTVRALSDYEAAFCRAVSARWPLRKAVVNHIAEYVPGPVSPMLEDGLKTGNLTVLTGKTVVAVHPRGKHDVGVLIHDAATGSSQVLRAATVSLAASALETVRILLNSRADNYPQGLGNRSGLLGAHLLEHLFTGLYANLTPKGDQGPNHGLSPFWLNREPTGFYFPPVVTHDVTANRDDYGLQGVISDTSGLFYLGAFARLKRPDANRMTLSDENIDGLGRRKPVISFRLQAEDRELLKHMANDTREMSRAFFDEIDQRPTIPLSVRLRDLVRGRDPKPTIGSNHESGGALMGTEAGKSVTSPEGNLWEAENVIVCDSACFPSLPAQNPTLTAMALAVRSTRLALERMR